MAEKKVEKKPVKKEEKKSNSNKAPTKWQLHLSKTWKEMQKKNPKAKFSEAMVAAKKTYKK
jgi:hypothetical protein